MKLYKSDLGWQKSFREHSGGANKKTYTAIKGRDRTRVSA